MAKATETARQETAPRQEADPTETLSYQAMLDSNGENLAALVKSSEAVLSGMANLSNEVMSFAGRRLQENIATSQDLSQCRDLQQAFQVQCEYARKATQHYLEEASKIMELATTAARDSMGPFEERTRETLRRMNGG